MAKLAFLFPGQGSQYAGMGKSLADEFPEAREVFAESDDVLGFSLSELCFNGPETDLKRTEYTQPALLATSIAAFRVLLKRAIHPDAVAGHSLGEYSALVAAGSLTLADALRLVRKRGQFMQQAVPEGVGAMAAILRLPEGALDQVLGAARQGEIVSAANFNSPDQIVIAGHAGAVARAMEGAKAAGARKVVPLPVSAPFHCELMKPAQHAMRPELEAVSFADLVTPLINNVDAREVRTGAEARDGLIRQIPGCVRWTDTVRALAALGVTRTIEVGAGGVLTGLLRSISPEITGIRFGEAAEFSKVAEATDQNERVIQ